MALQTEVKQTESDDSDDGDLAKSIAILTKNFEKLLKKMNKNKNPSSGKHFFFQKKNNNANTNSSFDRKKNQI